MDGATFFIALQGIFEAEFEEGIPDPAERSKSPTLRWEAGTHRVVFDHEKGHAELPIRLE